MTKYLIICPLVFIAGIIDAIAGGGGLITLPAYMIAGLPPHNAIATNKMSSTIGTATATVRYALDGFVPWKLSLICAAFSIGGSALGANISLKIDDSILRPIMLVLLPVTAAVVLKSRGISEEKEPLSKRATLLTAIATAFALGIYDGFYGPGSGTFLILLLTLAAHLKLTTANGVTKVMNFSSNVSALVVFLINGKVLLPLGLVAGLFSCAGNLIGTKLFAGRGAKIARPVMLAVLAVFFIKVICELAGV